MIRAMTMGLLLAGLAALGFAADKGQPNPTTARGTSEECDCCKEESASQRVFELRTYTTNEGKLEALHKRFREHTNRLFKKHGTEIVGYWTPQDAKDGKGDKLIY